MIEGVVIVDAVGSVSVSVGASVEKSTVDLPLFSKCTFCLETKFVGANEYDGETKRA